MVQRAENLSFPCESGGAIGVAGERLGKDLQRHVTIQFPIARPIDLAHSAGTDAAQDLIDAERPANHRRTAPKFSARRLSSSMWVRGNCNARLRDPQLMPGNLRRRHS
jgi:hypothetical protein